jgi:hypothetical protein
MNSCLSTTVAGLLALGTVERMLFPSTSVVSTALTFGALHFLCRGVAKYVKTLFDEESGLGRKSVAIDRLLYGKTRKEASRMFFETLVCNLLIYLIALS